MWLCVYSFTEHACGFRSATEYQNILFKGEQYFDSHIFKSGVQFPCLWSESEAVWVFPVSRTWCYPLAPTATLNLDFVTQLPWGDNGLSKPSLSHPSPWDWPFHCHARIFYTAQHQIISEDLFILNPFWRAWKWDLGARHQNSPKAHPTTVAHRLCAWSTESTLYPYVE